jgi:hypothetical protein
LSRWELKRLAIAVAVIDVVVAAACLGIAAAFGALDSGSIGTALFVAAIVLAFAGATAGGGVMPSHFPGNPHPAESLYQFGQAREHEMLALHTAKNISYHLEEFKNMSWVLVLGLAAVPLFVASVVLIFAFDV